MEHVITVLAVLGILGMFDEFFGNRLGLGESFSQGFAVMGRLALCMTGFYCIGISAVQANYEAVTALAAGLPFDPSLPMGCILCADSGGLPVALELAKSPALGAYTGALVGSGLGAMISFQMPVFLSTLDKRESLVIMRGFVYGLCTLPLGLAAGGFLLELPLGVWVMNTLPILVLCALLIAGVLAIPGKTLRFLTGFGCFIRFFSYFLFALVLFGVFVPRFALTDVQLVKESMYITLRTTIVACGGLTAAKLIERYLSRPLDAVAAFLGINHEAVVGLLLSCFQSVAMLPLFPEMDRCGKVMNAAFSVCGAFVLGGQMAFVAQMVPGQALAAYMANKIVCGVTAVIAVWLCERAEGNNRQQFAAHSLARKRL